MTEQTVIEEEAPATDADEQGEAQQPSVEDLAGRLGWAPEADWRGEGDQEWKDAATFLNEQVDSRIALKKTLKRQDGELVKVRETLEDFKTHYQSVNARAYKRAKADLEAERRKAATAGDANAVENIQNQIDSLDAPPAANGQDNPDNDPHFKAFHAENDWYGSDYEKTAYAEQIAPTAQRKGLEGAAFYAEIASEVERKFAPPKAKTRAQAVEGAGGIGAKRGGGAKSYQNLPADAKKACDNFVAEGLLTREEYIKTYEWEG